MNNSQFDTNLRNALTTPAASSTLDAKIDQAIGHHTHRRRVRRRVVISFTATAAAAFALIAFPAVQAQASLNSILRALDKQTRLKITTYTIDESGKRWPSATTLIANGDMAYIDAKGTRQQFDVGDKSYSLDPTIGRFIVRPRRPGGSIRFSDMLSGASGFSLGKRAEVKTVVQGGQSVLRAIIVNNGLPERYVFDADPKTELPLRAHVDSLEKGRWRTRHEMEFQYDVPVALVQPDLKRFPPTTDEESNAAFETAMTRQSLAEVRFRKGRIVVRAVDVSKDGTVFVAYQTGDRRPSTWSGYAINLADDLQTRYLRLGDNLAVRENAPRHEDGKIELEVFVPMRPVSPGTPRTLTFTTQKGPKGNLVRTVAYGAVFPDGSVQWRSGPNYFGEESDKATVLPVLRQKVNASTCESYPAWAAPLDATMFGNEVYAERAKVDYRAKQAMSDKNWSAAEQLLEEQLRLMRESERRGHSTWAMGGTLENLDKVRAAMRKPAP